MEKGEEEGIRTFTPQERPFYPNLGLRNAYIRLTQRLRSGQQKSTQTLALNQDEIKFIQRLNRLFISKYY